MINKTVGNQISGDQEKIEIEFAGFWRRFIAYQVDLIILSLMRGFIFRSKLLGSIESWAVTLINIGYFVWPYSTSGQTIGKQILGIRVVAIDGSFLNWRKGFLRFLGYIPSTIAFLMGFLWSIGDANKQAWHDKIAGTCVIRSWITQEKFLGIIDATEAVRRQRKWLAITGITTIVLLGVGGAFIWTMNQRIDNMAPWPSVSTATCQIVNPDLSHLGLQLDEITDAKNEKKWQGGHFSEGCVAKYSCGGEIKTIISILKYPSTESAKKDMDVMIDIDKENLFNNNYDISNTKGIFSWHYEDMYEKIFRNGRWIVDIMVVPDMNISQVRNGLVSHWHSKPSVEDR